MLRCLLKLLPRLLILGMVPGLARAAERVPIRDLAFLDVQGQVIHPADNNTARAVVLVFLSPECPICNQYTPELNHLREAYPPAVEIYGVVADPSLRRAAIARHAAEYKLSFPLVVDTTGELAAACRPTHVPEAFVLTPRGEMAYRGRIDDQYAAPGRRNAQVSHRELADAIDAVLAGRAPAVAQTDPIGCRFESARVERPVTYAREIAPILHARCAQCHRPGEVAPFSLLTYQDAAKRAEFISQLTQERRMPPWLARPGQVEFLHARRLTDRELELLEAWAKAGAPEGDAEDAPPVPEFSTGWPLGEPDLVLTMPEPFEVPAEAADIFRFFVIPIDLPEDKVVAAVDFRPGNPKVVHHAILYLDASGVARQLDANDPQPGYEGFLTGGFRPSGSLGFWAPGYSPRFLPPGVGQRLSQGSDLAMQLHYHPSGKAETDQSQVAIYFAKQPVERYLSGVAIVDFDVNIPPGEARHKMEHSFTTPVPLEVLDVTPHMHVLGTEMRLTATLPDGQTQPLVWVDWNFNWQEQYTYAEPVHLPAGTRLDLEAWFDNSSGNPYNPNQPPQRIVFGEETNDEMSICALRVLESTDPAEKKLLRQALSRNMQQQLNDPRVMLNVMQFISRGGGSEKKDPASLLKALRVDEE
ncbi:MAG: redoxin domain-containing protein [Pirellulales bacterium]|nr:redoxin domain-containing protein [Pirellulales bacterium]